MVYLPKPRSWRNEQFEGNRLLQTSLADLFNNHEQYVPFTQLGTQNKSLACKTPTLQKTRTRSLSPSSPFSSAITSPVANTPADIESEADKGPVKSIQKANSIQHSMPAVERQEITSHASALTSPYSSEETEAVHSETPSQSLRGRMNQSQRVPPGPATIMIGRKTVTAAGDSPVRKRQRLDPSQERNIASLETNNSSSSKLLNMVRSLTAPGTVMIPAVSQADEEDEDLDLSDNVEGSSTENSIPNAPQGRVSPPIPVKVSLDDSSPVAYEMNSVHQAEPVHVDASSQHQHDDQMGDQMPDLGGYEDDDEAYVDEQELRNQEKYRVKRLIEEAEAHVIIPSVENNSRAEQLLKGTSETSIKGRTQLVTADLDTIRRHSRLLKRLTSEFDHIHRLHKPSAPAKDAGELSPEERLTLTISKSDFTCMRIIGQFNRGFIITSRFTPPTDTTMGSEDLFIIDQHASDEKYNFETLQSTTVMRSQPLARHKPLHLMARDEEIVIDNIDNLKANGFTFEVDKNGPSGQKCKLLTLPMSENTVFDLQDLEELIHLMSLEGSGGSNEDGGFDKGIRKAKAPVVRPSKVRKMFAMRACRGSVMVGKALTISQMRKIVRHMAELDKPWNCPHGRPTMRHLCDLGQMSRWKKDFQGVTGCLYQGEMWREYILNFRKWGNSTGDD